MRGSGVAKWTLVLVGVSFELAFADSLPSRADVKAAVLWIAASEGVDPRLAAAVAETESSFDPLAVSGSGAVGVMQLMPETAASMGVRDLRSVRQNVTAGVRYLKRLQSLYRGDLRLALAAYNAGPGAVSKYDGVPPYMETREYVTAVLRRYYGVRRVALSDSLPRRHADTVRAGAETCGGSEIARDPTGRLYIRAHAVLGNCGRTPLR